MKVYACYGVMQYDHGHALFTRELSQENFKILCACISDRNYKEKYE